MRMLDEGSGLYYENKENVIHIVEGKHDITEAVIPQTINGNPVKVIRKKAFLSCKLLRYIYVPDEVESIGEFAFALCNHLEKVSLPHKDISLGQSVFKGDDELLSIEIRDNLKFKESDKTALSTDFQNIDSSNSISESVAALLAAAPVKMSADYLVDILHAGSADWFKMWDQKLLDILNRNDDEGYHLYVLCGEEDLHFDYEQYVEYVREKKAGLCILRLLNKDMLSKDNQQRLTDYLIMNTPMAQDDINGQDEHEGAERLGKIEKIEVAKKNSKATFEYLIKEHGDDKEYFELLINYGIITRNNREDLLVMLKDRHPETKAYLINAFKDNIKMDFFDDLLLL